MDRANAWIAEQQKWADAPGVLHASLDVLVLPTSVDIARITEFARGASDVHAADRVEKERQLATLLAELPEDRCILLGIQWLATTCVYLHLLIPEMLRARPGSKALAAQVLDWGISYPDPSLNRPFVEAAIAQLGRERTVQMLLDKTDGVAGAYYWLSGDATTTPDRFLRRRLRSFARYLSRWWKFW
jgi:hypothetical protein